MRAITPCRLPLALLLVVGVLLVPLWLASACGGPAKPPSTAPAASASASASAPLFTQSSGASPIHVSWKAGPCEVEMRDALGATYRFDAGSKPQAEQALRNAADACLGAGKGTQGTLYIEGTVASTGALSDVFISPGGAISTDVAQCLTKSFHKAQLPVPEKDGSVLMLFVVSACPVP